MNNLRRRILNKSGVDIDPTTGRGFVDGYEVVDLGLPSGLLWATCNVGALAEGGIGNYYQWGTGAVTYKNKDQYHRDGDDNGYTLPSSADTATQVMGKGWRMPTEDEINELIDNTDFSVANANGIRSGKLTSKLNPNAYVFFPFAGNYRNGSFEYYGTAGFFWSSTSYGYKVSQLLCCDIWEDDYLGNAGERNWGFSVRGVHAAV